MLTNRYNSGPCPPELIWALTPEATSDVVLPINDWQLWTWLSWNIQLKDDEENVPFSWYKRLNRRKLLFTRNWNECRFLLERKIWRNKDIAWSINICLSYKQWEEIASDRLRKRLLTFNERILAFFKCLNRIVWELLSTISFFYLRTERKRKKKEKRSY